MQFTQELKDKWVGALRSGEYQQCQGALKRNDSAYLPGGFCCLGVLADVAGGTFNDDGTVVLEGVKLQPTNFLLRAGELGRHSIVEGLSVEDQRQLARMNDGDYSFAAIASRIDADIPAVDVPASKEVA